MGQDQVLNDLGTVALALTTLTCIASGNQMLDQVPRESESLLA